MTTRKVVCTAVFLLAGLLLVVAQDPGASDDAVVAAPDSHRILLENDRVRVLEVVIPPGVKEPMHTHVWESVMLVDGPARIRYYNSRNEAVFESPADRPPPPERPDPEWMRSEGLHAVENIDTRPFHAIRIELKD